MTNENRLKELRALYLNGDLSDTPAPRYRWCLQCHTDTGHPRKHSNYKCNHDEKPCPWINCKHCNGRGIIKLVEMPVESES